MGKTSLITSTDILKGFTDVLFLSNHRNVPPEVKKLLKHKHLTYLLLPIDKFPQILHQLDMVGTVVIDIEELGVSHQQKLARIIETLELNNICAILLSKRVVSPVKSFSLAGPSLKSFSVTDTMESVSVDEMWSKISINLAYRKKSNRIIISPSVPSGLVERSHSNKLAEQLRMAEALMESLTEQLRMAGLVQRDFLPSQLPDTNEVQWATSFLPAEWVSGDIYDVVRVDEQHIGFYVADAVGHSMPAALLTIFLKQALVMRETIENNYRIFSPAEVIKNLNMRMAAQKLSGYQFATCCYCLLNIKTLQLTFARAGHPYPVLIRHRKPPQQLESRGSLLGIFEQAEYVQQTIQLHHGDKLLVYSDGLEPFIGGFDDTTGFRFNEEFCKIKDLPLWEMFDRLNAVIQSKKINPSEVDDITAIALEVR